MYVVYKFTTKQYEPLSLGPNYLYVQYDKLISFLKQSIFELQNDVIAKPVISGSDVLWYASSSAIMNRLTHFPEEVQQKVKIAYWGLKKQVDQRSTQLLESQNAAEREWGIMLSDVFNDENNILVTDGERWCILWGWKFSNHQENYLPPFFFSHTEQSIDISSLTVSETQIPIQPPSLATERIVGSPKRSGLWVAFIHYIRRLTYRIWGLMFLIILLLFMSCLLNKCMFYNRNSTSSTYHQYVNLQTAPI